MNEEDPLFKKLGELAELRVFLKEKKPKFEIHKYSFCSLLNFGNKTLCLGFGNYDVNSLNNNMDANLFVLYKNVVPEGFEVKTTNDEETIRIKLIRKNGS